MIALDTNVLVRFIVRDHPDQSRAAHDMMGRLSEGDPGFVCREVILELAWVLERAYGIDRQRIADVLTGLIASREVEVETAGEIAPAVAAWRDGGPSLADRMIVAAAARAGARALVTFDRAAARLPGAELLE
ncbi:MAG: type II toxin-antitoxin system VapC family toxin [Amaricoccus sp.]